MTNQISLEGVYIEVANMIRMPWPTNWSRGNIFVLKRCPPILAMSFGNSPPDTAHPGQTPDGATVGLMSWQLPQKYRIRNNCVWLRSLYRFARKAWI